MQDKIIGKLVEIDAYMRENLVTNERFEARLADISDQIDGFVKSHLTLDEEHTALHSRVDRIESDVAVLKAVGKA